MSTLAIVSTVEARGEKPAAKHCDETVIDL
jgi:hypothetical protein